MAERRFQINPGPLNVVDTSARTPAQGRGVHPKEEYLGPVRYGVALIEAGLYLHASGDLIIRTGSWEGPRGGSLSRWEVARYDDAGRINVGDDGRLFRTLREAAAALDMEHANG